MCRRGSLEEKHISGGRNQEFTFGQGRSAASLILTTELLVDLNIHMVFYIMGADEITYGENMERGEKRAKAKF